MRILAPLLRYDYGKPQRGDSLEKTAFVPAMSSCTEVYPFWLEEHGFPDDLEGLQQAIILEAERLNPDLLFFILMRDEIRISTLEALGRHWNTANWFCDDQWRFNSFTRFVAPALTYSITVDKFSLPSYLAIGCRKVILSQWAGPYTPLGKTSSGFDYEVSFIGGRNSSREWYVRALQKANIEVACFGAGWPAGRVSFTEMQTIMRRSKICLNLSNSQPRDVSYGRYIRRRAAAATLGINVGPDGYVPSLRRAAVGVSNFYHSTKRVEQIKARNFEIPAWGGFQLSQFALGIEDYFIPGREIALFSTTDELVQLVLYYLVNDEEREAMRIAGNRRAAEHTYENRMRAIIERIESDKGLHTSL